MTDTSRDNDPSGRPDDTAPPAATPSPASRIHRPEKKRGRARWVVLLLLLSFLGGIWVEAQYRPYQTLEGYLMPAAVRDPGYSLPPALPASPGPQELCPVSPVVPIAREVLPAVVAIESRGVFTTRFGARYESQGTGSGIIVDPDGYIITNEHVIRNAESLRVILHDQTVLEAEIVGADALSDLAVIRVDRRDLPFAQTGDSDALQVGELVVAMGSPVGISFAGSVTSGIISGLNRQVHLGDRTMNLIQTDAAINPGNSGGALVNARGEVIGINVLKFATADVEGMSFSIPINEAVPIVEELIRKGRVVRPNLGIRGRDIHPDEQESYGVPAGVLVLEVSPGSGAQQAGLQPGDIITHYQGERVETIGALVDRIQQGEVGDRVRLQVHREGRERMLEAVLTERPGEE